MFTVASGALWLGASVGWTGPTFRVFYLFGAVVNVPVLALGTLYLLGDHQRARRWCVVVALGSAFAAGVVVVAPFRQPVPVHRLPQGSEVFGPLPRVLAAVASTAGAVVVLSGAVVSTLRHRRRVGAGGGRMVGANALIAAGTVVLAGGGLANSVVGEMEAFALSLVTGVLLLFGGFLVAVSRPPPVTPVPGSVEAFPGGVSVPEDEELDDGRDQDGQEQQADQDGRRRPHPA